jgi:hypothetical protein
MHLVLLPPKYVRKCEKDRTSSGIELDSENGADWDLIKAINYFSQNS